MKNLLIGLAVLVPAWSAAAAQSESDLRVRVGLGAQLRPKYTGADVTSVAPLFDVSFAHGTEPFSFSAPDDRPSIALLSSNGFSLGPSANLTARRKASDVGAPVGDVKRTIEVGAFAQYYWNDSFRLRAELLKGVNGHEGLVGTIGADKVWRDGDRYVFSIGPRVLYSDARFQRAYFGVTPAASLASGLPVYRPRGGIYGVAVASGLNYSLSKRWGLFGFARYERLVGDAARSPIVRQFGSRNQLSSGIGLNYTFIVHRGHSAPAQ